MLRPRFFAFLLAGLLAIACAIPAGAAEEISCAVPSESGISSQENTPAQPVRPQPETAASEAEMLCWLEAHKATGGTLTLTADVTMTECAEFSIIAPVTIDCAGHRLFVAHQFSLMGYVVIKGAGSDEGLVRIMPGAMLSLDYGATVSPESGVAVWQEEGAAFCNGADPATGNPLASVHYAQTPVIVGFDSGDNLIVVPKGGAYETLLPGEKKATVNQAGANDLVNIPMPLGWDTAAAKDALALKKRTTLTGSFTTCAMLSTLTPPSCTVVFREREVFFERFAVRGTDAYLSMFLSYFLPPRPLEVTLCYSFDGESFSPLLQQTHDGTEETGAFQPALIRESGYTGELAFDEILWPADGNAGALQFVISYEENGSTVYSDVICFDGKEFTPGEEYEGNRGGGGELDGGDGPPSGNGGLDPDGPGSEGPTGGPGDSIIVLPPAPEAQPPEKPSTKPSASAIPLTDIPQPPVQTASPQVSAASAAPTAPKTPQPQAAEPDAVPLSKPLQIGIGAVVTLGVLAAFVFYGKKR